jgi:hypothetical protein
MRLTAKRIGDWSVAGWSTFLYPHAPSLCIRADGGLDARPFDPNMRIPLEIRVAYAGLNKFRPHYAPEKNGAVRATWGDQNTVKGI